MTAIDMATQISQADRQFESAFLSGRFPLEKFDHRAHIRLAYIVTVGETVERAQQQMREALINFLEVKGVGASKYHETITRAWIMAVRHFLEQTDNSSDADDFIARHPQLLNPNIMLTHYSEELLFSEQARQHFIQADIEAIPEYSKPSNNATSQ